MLPVIRRLLVMVGPLVLSFMVTPASDWTSPAATARLLRRSPPRRCTRSSRQRSSTAQRACQSGGVHSGRQGNLVLRRGSGVSPVGRGDRERTVALSDKEAQPVSADMSMTMIQERLVGGRWYMQTGQRDRGNAVLLTHSADGKLLASVNSNNAVVVLEPATGKHVRRIDLKEMVSALVLSRDGRLLAVCDVKLEEANNIHLWNVQEGKELATLKLDPGCIATKLVFSDDGKQLAAILNNTQIRIWSVSTAKRVRAYDHLYDKNNNSGAPAMINAIAFSHNGRLLASAGGSGVIHIWETDCDEESKRFTSAESYFTAVVFSQDDNSVVAADNKVNNNKRDLHIWNLATGREDVVECGAEIAAVAVSPDGSLIAAACDSGVIQLWDTFTREKKWSDKRLEQLNGMGLLDGGRTLVLWTATGNIRHIDALTGVTRHTAKGPDCAKHRVLDCAHWEGGGNGEGR